jgi:hypothetical protein
MNHYTCLLSRSGGTCKTLYMASTVFWDVVASTLVDLAHNMASHPKDSTLPTHLCENLKCNLFTNGTSVVQECPSLGIKECQRFIYN